MTPADIETLVALVAGIGRRAGDTRQSVIDVAKILRKRKALARQREQCITERIRTSPSGTPEQTCREAYPSDRDHPTRWCVGCQLAALVEGR